MKLDLHHWLDRLREAVAEGGDQARILSLAFSCRLAGANDVQILGALDAGRALAARLA